MTNKNGIPNDPRPPRVTSGLRLGTPALTTRGLGVEEMKEVAALLDRVMGSHGDPEVCEAVRKDVRSMCDRFPATALRLISPSCLLRLVDGAHTVVARLRLLMPGCIGMISS